MIKRTCSLPDCNKAHRARGLCATHYNQQHMPNRHPKKLVPCAFCGTEVLKGTGGGRIHGAVCSDQCRQWLSTPYSVLPKDHWARWYGKTCEWKPPAPKAPTFIREPRQCAWCPESFMQAMPHQEYCSKRCGNKASKMRRRACVADSPGMYTWAQVIGLHLKAGKLCSYCDQLTAEPEPDHVIPISRGGRNGIENILPCCSLCNADKGDMTPEEWAANRARRDKRPVRTGFNPSDPRFKHLKLGAPNRESYRLAQEAHLTCA